VSAMAYLAAFHWGWLLASLLLPIGFFFFAGTHQ